MAMISEAELEKILAECRKKRPREEAVARVLRTYPGGTLAPLPPMISIPSLPREEPAPPAPASRTESPST